MAATVVKSVPIKSLKAASWNPPNRVKNVTNLARSIEEVGHLQPVLVTKDLEIIDGHRRVAALKELGRTEVLILIATGDQAKLFAEINSTGHSISGNDALLIYLSEPTALTQHMRTRIESCEEIIGKPLLARMAREGMSLTSWYLAGKIAAAADLDNDEMMRDIMKWLLRFRCYKLAKQALSQGTEPSRLIAAVKRNKPLRLRVTAAA